MAFALATAVLPLGNISLGLALLFAALACGWIALTWRDARNGLLFVAGPLLLPLGAIGLMPLVAQLARGPARARRAGGDGRARGRARRGAPARGLPVRRLRAAARDRHRGQHATDRGRRTRSGACSTAHPALLAEAAVFAAAAIAIPYCRGRGPWLAAGFGAAFLAAMVIAAPAAPLLPLIGSAWLIAAILAFEQMRLETTKPAAARRTTRRITLRITLGRRGRPPA